MNPRFFVVINPAAGGGRCGRLGDSALNLVRQTGAELEIMRTTAGGDARDAARRAYQRGFRLFRGWAAMGTAFEVVNGLFPPALAGERPALAMPPLGTGNSFLKDFTRNGFAHTIDAIENRSRRACDLIRLRHANGGMYSLNLVGPGFPAEVGELTNRRFKGADQFGYVLGVFLPPRAPRTRNFSSPPRRRPRMGPPPLPFPRLQ